MPTINEAAIQSSINSTIKRVTEAMENYGLPPFEEEGSWLLVNADRVGEDV